MIFHYQANHDRLLQRRLLRPQKITKQSCPGIKIIILESKNIGLELSNRLRKNRFTYKRSFTSK